jgi:hypothetical protein
MTKRNLITFNPIFSGSTDHTVSYNGTNVAVVGESRGEGFAIRAKANCPRSIKAVALGNYATRQDANTAILAAAQ